MGQVWEATDRVLERPVAVKILRQDLVDSGDFLTRFRVEARLAAGLSHPGIAHVYDYAEDVHDGERVAFLVMELVDGQPLSDQLGRPDPLHLSQIVSILGQTAEALGAAHQLGIVHRDIKPGNLLITADGRVKVTDFGIARAIDSASITEVGEVIGTVRYMSPEQAMGQEATPASDVYSLAVVGYEMLSGRPAVHGRQSSGDRVGARAGRRPPALPASAPSGLRSLIERSLAKSPEQRPSDGAVFASELHELTIEPGPRACRPHRVGCRHFVASAAPAVPIEPTAVLPQVATLAACPGRGAAKQDGDAPDADLAALTEIAPHCPRCRQRRCSVTAGSTPIYDGDVESRRGARPPPSPCACWFWSLSIGRATSVTHRRQGRAARRRPSHFRWLLSTP